jgi:hypothetical protein
MNETVTTIGPYTIHEHPFYCGRTHNYTYILYNGDKKYASLRCPFFDDVSDIPTLKIFYLPDYNTAPIKILLHHAHSKLNIPNCIMLEDDIYLDYPKGMDPSGDMRHPMKLSHYSVIYNNMTYYEAYYNATMKDAEKYKAYREALHFLDDPSQKPDFHNFLRIIIATSESIFGLEKYYNSAKTYREFFDSIPLNERYELLGGWLEYFIRYYLPMLYHSVWTIRIDDMEQKGGLDANALTGSPLIEYFIMHCI